MRKKCLAHLTPRPPLRQLLLQLSSRVAERGWKIWGMGGAKLPPSPREGSPLPGRILVTRRATRGRGQGWGFDERKCSSATC